MLGKTVGEQFGGEGDVLLSTEGKGEGAEGAWGSYLLQGLGVPAAVPMAQVAYPMAGGILELGV